MHIVFWGITTFLLVPFLTFQPLQSSTTSLSHSSSIHEIVLSIPDKDIEVLKAFFKCLFVHSGFAYTLLEEKPMVCVDYNLDAALKGLAGKKIMHSMAIAYKGSQVWGKYKHLFRMHQFEFIDYASSDFSTFGFILFNKKAMQIYFEKNKDLLTPVFGDVQDLSWVLKHSSLPKESLRPQYHQALGTLLGYGIKNTVAFRKRNEMYAFLKKAPLNLGLLNDVDRNCIQLGQASSVNDEMAETRDLTHRPVCEAIQTLNDLRSNFKFIPTTNRGTALAPIELPGFLAFPEDEETQRIKQSYDRVRAQIVEILYSENFLEKILKLLTS